MSRLNAPYYPRRHEYLAAPTPPGMAGPSSPVDSPLYPSSDQMMTGNAINRSNEDHTRMLGNMGLAGRGSSPQAFPNPNARAGGATMAPTAPTPPNTNFTGMSSPTPPGMASPYGDAMSGYGAPAAPAARGMAPGAGAPVGDVHRRDELRKEYDALNKSLDAMGPPDEKGVHADPRYAPTKTAWQNIHDQLYGKEQSASPSSPAPTTQPSAPAPIPLGAPGHPRLDPNVTGHGNLTEAYQTAQRSLQQMQGQSSANVRNDPGTLASAQTNLDQLSGGSATANNANYVGARMLGNAPAMNDIRQTENQRQQLVGQNQQTVHDVNARAQTRDPGQIQMQDQGLANVNARLQQFGRGNYDLSAPTPFPPQMAGDEGRSATAANLGAPYAPTNYGPSMLAGSPVAPAISAPVQPRSQTSGPGTAQPAAAGGAIVSNAGALATARGMAYGRGPMNQVQPSIPQPRRAQASAKPAAQPPSTQPAAAANQYQEGHVYRIKATGETFKIVNGKRVPA